MLMRNETREQQLIREQEYEKKFGAKNAADRAVYEDEISVQKSSLFEQPLGFAMNLADKLMVEDKIVRKNGVIINDAC